MRAFNHPFRRVLGLHRFGRIEGRMQVGFKVSPAALMVWKHPCRSPVLDAATSPCSGSEQLSLLLWTALCGFTLFPLCKRLRGPLGRFPS